MSVKTLRIMKNQCVRILRRGERLLGLETFTIRTCVYVALLPRCTVD